MRTLLLGEAIVDLICERPVASFGEADAFVPHLGGSVANIAAGAARRGAPVALAAVAGDDPWGRWLRERLAREGVDLTWLRLLDGVRTPLAFTTVDAQGAPAYAIYGDTIAQAAEALADELLGAVEACDAVLFTSNTIAGERERALTYAARDRALELGKPILVDPNIRLHRWETPAFAASESRELVKGAFLVKCNAEEARLLTGEEQPVAAAEGLVAMGARHAIVATGHGAVARGGGLKLARIGRETMPVSRLGAGDAFMSVILAQLASTDFYAPAIGAALPAAVEEAAQAVERWGALE